MRLESGLQRFTIKTKEWGPIKVLRPVPEKDNPWGVLSPLKDTPWGDLIPHVSGTNFSHALHGHATPLMNEIGREPHALLRLVPAQYRVCSLSNTCITYEAGSCHPCPKLPACYEPPSLETLEQKHAVLAVVMAWKEGRYVLIVEGEEFNL